MEGTSSFSFSFKLLERKGSDLEGPLPLLLPWLNVMHLFIIQQNLWQRRFEY